MESLNIVCKNKLRTSTNQKGFKLKPESLKKNPDHIAATCLIHLIWIVHDIYIYIHRLFVLTSTSSFDSSVDFWPKCYWIEQIRRKSFSIANIRISAINSYLEVNKLTTQHFTISKSSKYKQTFYQKSDFEIIFLLEKTEVWFFKILFPYSTAV